MINTRSYAQGKTSMLKHKQSIFVFL